MCIPGFLGLVDCNMLALYVTIGRPVFVGVVGSVLRRVHMALHYAAVPVPSKFVEYLP
jgi:hypothetical protein